MLAYLLDVSLCWLIFYLLYYFWLSKETFFHLNRWYLLGTLVLGLIIPLVPSPFGAEVQESEWVTLYVAPINMGLESLEVTVTSGGDTTWEFDWLVLLKWIYWGGVILSSLRFLSGLWRIGSLYLRAEHIRVGQYRVALTNEAHLPFSFFRVIFKSKTGNLDEFSEQKITDHELAHVRGWHTIDVLLVEVVSILLWCSPPVHLYRRSLRIVHEYIADSAAIRTGQKKKYGHLLIRQSQSGLQLALANHFIQSQLKKRITMMTRTRSQRQAFLKYLPVIPLLVVALVVFSNWEAVAGDRLDILNTESLTQTKNAADEYDPRIFRKKLSAALHQRQQMATDEDVEIVKAFTDLHNDWAAKYPEHAKEIQGIAEEVAETYQLNVEFTDNKVKAAHFRQSFEAFAKGRKYTILPGSEAPLKFKMPEGENPYILINDKPAPADWKAQLDKNKIERIEVLKGEAAVKAYGQQAKNGAIQIYTKDFRKAENTMPRFPGCEHIADLKKRQECADQNLREHLFANLKYPEGYAKYKVQGTVIAQYTVDKTGKVKNVRIVRTIGGGFNKAVEEVLQNMPAFIPGTIDGAAADVEVTLPIKFMASEEEVHESPGTPDPMVIISSLESQQNKPLFIVDGVIFEDGNIESIHQDDIDRIDVLKGEQALKEYGERGANGVVRIFTKMRAYDVSPVFPGCEGLEGEEQLNCSAKSFLTQVYRNIKYPTSARNANIEGMVVVKYTISEEGKVTNARIARKLDEALDAEVLRVIGELPDWKPALKDGKPVAVDLVLPVRFKIEGYPVEPNQKAVVRTEEEPKRKTTEANGKGMVKGELMDEVVVIGYGHQRAEREALTMVEEMPRFPGCEEETDPKTRSNCAIKRMMEFVYNRIAYTKSAKEAGIEGMIVASFIVNKQGGIEDIRIERGLGYGLNEQVIETIKLMPKWVPGKQDGKTVDVAINLPVRFLLASKKAKQNTMVKEKPAAPREPATLQTPTPDNQLRLQNFRAAPNPTTGLISLRFQSEAKPLSLRIMTAEGKIVYQRQFPQFGGNFEEQIDLQDAPKGTLFIAVQQGEQVHTSTVILQ